MYRSSRRDFVRAASLGAAALGLGIDGRRASAQTGEINMVGWNAPGLREVFARAEREIGVKVNYDVLPTKWDDVMQKITLWGQTGYSGIDVLFADDLISGLWGMNGWAEDLSGLDAWTKHENDVVDNIHVFHQAVGGVYRIFFTMGFEPFFFDKRMVQTPPASWDELVTKAKAATSPANGVWGWRPLGGEGHAFNTVLLMLDQAGANLETLEDPATLTALRFMYDWVHTDKITPPSTVSEDQTVVAALAAAGKAAMWWTYEGGYNTLLSTSGTKLTADDIGVARWPKGPLNDNGLVHGWGYMLSKFSNRKSEAKEVINWLAQPGLIRDVDLVQGSAPPYRSLFAEPQIVAKLPVLKAGPGWEALIKGARFREPIVNHPQVTQLWSLFDKLGGYTLSGQKAPKDAQAWAVEEYASIRG